MVECVVKTTLSLVLLLAVQASFAFEGDYVWDGRFKEALTKAALGAANDQYELGEMYLKGRGTQKKPAEALAWFLKAAQQGHIKAAYKVGHMYLLGVGAKRSLREALNWLQVAAEGEYAPAQYELGKFYASDETDGRENSLALIWLGKAKKNGFQPAEEAFAELIRRMVKVQKADDATSP